MEGRGEGRDLCRIQLLGVWASSLGVSPLPFFPLSIPFSSEEGELAKLFWQSTAKINKNNIFFRWYLNEKEIHSEPEIRFFSGWGESNEAIRMKMNSIVYVVNSSLDFVRLGENFCF